MCFKRHHARRTKMNLINLASGQGLGNAFIPKLITILILHPYHLPIRQIFADGFAQIVVGKRERLLRGY